MVKDFFVRWMRGIKAYSSSVEGLLVSKLFFLGFVVFGLFVYGSLLWFRGGSFWLGLIMVSFGFVSLVDFRLLWLSLKRLRLQEDMVKSLEGG